MTNDKGQEGRQRSLRHCVDLVEMASPLRSKSALNIIKDFAARTAKATTVR